MSYTEGSMSTEELKKLFGDSLQVRDDGHVTFSNDGDTDKFMNNSQLKSTFTGAMGRDEGDWDDGLKSENDLGAVVRYLSEESSNEKAKSEEPYVESQHLKDAKERVSTWENRFDNNGNDTWTTEATSDAKKVNNQSDNAAHYLDNYKLNLREKNKQRKDKAANEPM